MVTTMVSTTYRVYEYVAYNTRRHCREWGDELASRVMRRGKRRRVRQYIGKRNVHTSNR